MRSSEPLMNGNEKQAEPDLVVSNAGPLISLSTVSQLDLLRALFGQIAIPQAVYDEVVVHGEGEPGSREVGESDWIRIQHVKDHLAVELLRETLDAGESEAIWEDFVERNNRVLSVSEGHELVATWGNLANARGYSGSC